jgi:hypothetical protein
MRRRNIRKRENNLHSFLKIFSSPLPLRLCGEFFFIAKEENIL